MYRCFLARRSRCSAKAWWRKPLPSSSGPLHFLQSCVWTIMWAWACVLGHLLACRLGLASSWPKLWARCGSKCMCVCAWVSCVCWCLCRWGVAAGLQEWWEELSQGSAPACKQCCCIKMQCIACKFQDALFSPLDHLCTRQVKSDMLMQHLGVHRFELGCWEDGVRWSNYGEVAVVTRVQNQRRGVADLGKATSAPRKLILSHFLCLILGEGSWSSHTHQRPKNHQMLSWWL